MFRVDRVEYDEVKAHPIHPTTALTLFCLPVSGNRFVAQCGLLGELHEAYTLAFNSSLTPDLVFASSGGNIAAYTAMAGDWTSCGIRRVAAKLDPKAFIQSWFPKPFNFIPSCMVGLKKGSVYRHGYGTAHLLNTIFTPETIQRVEIWTGAYDIKHRRAQFFCNRSQHNALIRPDYFNDASMMYGCMPLKYLDGDVDLIAAAASASASIPYLVNPESINGLTYSDGGIMYASGLSVMHDEVYRLTCTGRKLRLIYFASYDMDTTRPDLDTTNRTFVTLEAVSQIIHANILQDRGSAIELLNRLAGNSANVKYTHHKFLNTQLLADLLVELEDVTHYVLILYPSHAPSIKITSFKPHEVLEQIDIATRGYGCWLWTYTEL